MITYVDLVMYFSWVVKILLFRQAYRYYVAWLKMNQWIDFWPIVFFIKHQQQQHHFVYNNRSPIITVTILFNLTWNSEYVYKYCKWLLILFLYNIVVHQYKIGTTKIDTCDKIRTVGRGGFGSLTWLWGHRWPVLTANLIPPERLHEKTQSRM